MPETLTDKIRLTFATIPYEVRRFVIKGALLLIGWCLLYGLLLKPYDLVDPTLTKYTAKATILLLQLICKGKEVVGIYTTRYVIIYINNKQVLSIWDPCNGLDLYVLFTGFIFCISMSVKKMVMYIGIGVGCIFIINVLRCLGLIYLFKHYPDYADFAHHYVFQLMVYAAIFLIWERYFRSLKITHEAA